MTTPATDASGGDLEYWVPDTEPDPAPVREARAKTLSSADPPPDAGGAEVEEEITFEKSAPIILGREGKIAPLKRREDESPQAFAVRRAALRVAAEHAPAPGDRANRS